MRVERAVVEAVVSDERDRRVVAAEGRAGQGQPPRGRLEGLGDRVPPAQRVAGVVDLVEDDERPGVLGAGPVVEDAGRDAGVGDDDAVVLAAAAPPTAPAQAGVELDADLGGGPGPLGLEVLGGTHDDDAPDRTGAEQFGGHPQGEGRLAGSGGRHGEEVARRRRGVEVEGGALPGAQSARGAPRGAAGEGRRQMLESRGAHRASPRSDRPSLPTSVPGRLADRSAGAGAPSEPGPQGPSC